MERECTRPTATPCNGCIIASPSSGSHILRPTAPSELQSSPSQPASPKCDRQQRGTLCHDCSGDECAEEARISPCHGRVLVAAESREKCPLCVSLPTNRMRLHSSSTAVSSDRGVRSSFPRLGMHRVRALSHIRCPSRIKV